MWGQRESHAGGRGARNRGFCLTNNDALFKGRTEGPQSSQFGPKTWMELHKAGEKSHPIHQLPTVGAAGFTSRSMGGDKDGREVTMLMSMSPAQVVGREEEKGIPW